MIGNTAGTPTDENSEKPIEHLIIYSLILFILLNEVSIEWGFRRR